MTRPTESEVREWLARLVNSGLPDATLARRVCEDWLMMRREWSPPAPTCKHGTHERVWCEECDAEYRAECEAEEKAKEPPHA